MAKSTFPSLVAGEPRWDVGQAAALRDFITTPSGQSFLRQMIYLRPLVQEMTNPFKRQVQQDTRSGFEQAIAEILRLAEPPTSSQADERAATSETQRQTANS